MTSVKLVPPMPMLAVLNVPNGSIQSQTTLQLGDELTVYFCATVSHICAGLDSMGSSNSSSRMNNTTRVECEYFNAQIRDPQHQCCRCGPDILRLMQRHYFCILQTECDA